jgi:CRISPR-associated endonuclease Cas1 subtype II
MGWRTVVVNKNCKLSYKNDYLIIRSEDLKMIHLSEIRVIIIENTMVSITSYLINELANQKIRLIFCDEKHNPSCEVMPYYGAVNTSKRIQNQINWSKENKEKAWQQIIKYKIHNQAILLKNLCIQGYEKLLEYENQVELNDKTNREGHAAKVYFNLLFGKEFTRGSSDNTNIALDYGYSILLSIFNREIISKGYITPIGINHKNEFNQFNLSCDLMEIFRPLVDEVVYNNREFVFDKEFKYKLIDLYNRVVSINDKEQYLPNAVNIFISNVFNYLESDKKECLICNYEF